MLGRVLVWIPVWSIFFFATGCQQDSSAQRSPTPVTVFHVADTAPVSESRYAAIIEPNSTVNVSSQVEGMIQTIVQRDGPEGQPRDLQGGDRVDSGTLLAVIQPDSYQQRLGESQADLARARALDADQTANWERSKALYAQQVIPQSQYDTAKASYDSAKADVARAEHAVEESRIQLGHTRITSPMSGVILSREVEAGDVAHPGMTIFQVGDVRHVKAVFGAPSALAARLELGTPVHLTIESFKGRDFVGRITKVAAETDRQSGVFDVDVTLDNPEETIKPGLVAEVQIPKKLLQWGGTVPLSVPMDSIVRPPDDSKAYAVFVVDENKAGLGTGTARLRRVELGAPLGDQIEVDAGLDANSVVVVRGSTILTNGAEVRIIP